MRRIAFATLLSLSVASEALAFEVVQLDQKPLRLDITATTIGAWHGDNRNTIDIDDGYQELLNRFNFQLSYWKLVGALRLDTATFGALPDPAELARRNARDPNDAQELTRLQNRYWENMRNVYRDAYWIGKSFLTYSSPHLDVTAGDAYVSFGRGLVLSMRKQDELAIDNTLLGGKVAGRWPIFNFTAVAGVANPVRVDEATAQTLFQLDASPTDVAAGRAGAKVYGEDRLFGAKTELTRWGGALSLQAARLQRLDTLGVITGVRGAKNVDSGGVSLSAPLPAQLGTAYVEGALQRYRTGADGAKLDRGSALYASVSAGKGPVTGLVELQHYRDFDPLYASVNVRTAPAFQTLAYSSPPTTEPAITDTRYLYFNRCVTGGRTRVDGRINGALLVNAVYGHWTSWGERDPLCQDSPDPKRNEVNDGSIGSELVFDGAGSHAIATAGLRHDHNAEDGTLFYRELYAQVQVAKAIAGPWSVELDGRNRKRLHSLENVSDDTGRGSPWNEGEVYLSLKYSPQLIASLGFEYTGQAGRPPTYYNGGVVWKYRSDSSVKLFAGQQRGALKCVSGVCREFPAFEGVKLEWTQRY